MLFALGLVTPLAALAIAAVMPNAIATGHWKNGLFAGSACSAVCDAETQPQGHSPLRRSSDATPCAIANT